ncbi:hypothetical protein GY45DRAFT_1113478 [Cubamyces sp. BRFM 1775]|nr:hypothetical protein GY45DRAFT_1113478 [Cubamyces sp. BRFM 1775]
MYSKRRHQNRGAAVVVAGRSLVPLTVTARYDPDGRENVWAVCGEGALVSTLSSTNRIRPLRPSMSSMRYVTPDTNFDESRRSRRRRARDGPCASYRWIFSLLRDFSYARSRPYHNIIPRPRTTHAFSCAPPPYGGEQRCGRFCRTSVLEPSGGGGCTCHQSEKSLCRRNAARRRRVPRSAPSSTRAQPKSHSILPAAGYVPAVH